MNLLRFADLALGIGLGVVLMAALLYGWACWDAHKARRKMRRLQPLLDESWRIYHRALKACRNGDEATARLHLARLEEIGEHIGAEADRD